MVRNLINLFVKTQDEAQRRKQIGMLCGSVNAASNILLFLLKLIVGILSGSVAVTADAFNNLSDTFSSIVTIAGFKMSQRAPDKKHPFGYGRFEYVAGVIVSVLVLTVGVEFIRSSIDKIINPQIVEYSHYMLVVLIIAILIKLWMWYANTKFADSMGGSETLKATAVDSISDVATTGVALLSLILSSRFESFPIDGLMGLVIAVAVIIAGFRILLDTISPLLGQSASSEMVKKIRDSILKYDGILGVHDIIIHNYGPMKIIVTLHAEVAVDCDIISIHEVIDRAEREIGDKLGITMIIHLDPIVTNDKKVTEARSLVERCLKQLNPEYEMHDFRIVDGYQDINLVFDVLVPYGLDKSDQEIKQDIKAAVKKINQSYNSVITIDKSFTD